MSKYHSKKVETEDGLFDSHREKRRWYILKQMEKDGEITELRRQIPFELVPHQELDTPRKMKVKTKGAKPRTQRSETAVKYFADFTYMKNGKLVVEDSKGMKTPEYVIKRKLMKYVHGIEIVEV
mgnify:CR=1 FL=1